jgi:hypothetical protein
MTPSLLRPIGLLAALAPMVLWAGSGLAGPNDAAPIIVAQGKCQNVEAFNACVGPKLLACNNGRLSQAQQDQCRQDARDGCRPQC